MRFRKAAQNRLLRINEKVEEEIANNIISEGAFDTEADRKRMEEERLKYELESESDTEPDQIEQKQDIKVNGSKYLLHGYTFIFKAIFVLLDRF